MINSQMKGNNFWVFVSPISTRKIENKTGHFLQLLLNQFSTTILYKYSIGPNNCVAFSTVIVSLVTFTVIYPHKITPTTKARGNIC